MSTPLGESSLSSEVALAQASTRRISLTAQPEVARPSILLGEKLRSAAEMIRALPDPDSIAWAAEYLRTINSSLEALETMPTADQAVAVLETFGKAAELLSRLEADFTATESDLREVPGEDEDSISTPKEAGSTSDADVCSRTALQRESDRLLAEAAKNHGDDARSQSLLMWALFGLGLALALGAFWSSSRILTDQVINTTASELLIMMLPPALLATLGAVFLFLANQVRRSRDESRRLQRQVEMLPSYVMPLPKVAQDLLRTVMVQRLFPRLLGDDDPTRESDWFPADNVIALALDPEFAAAVAADSEAD